MTNMYDDEQQGHSLTHTHAARQRRQREENALHAEERNSGHEPNRIGSRVWLQEKTKQKKNVQIWPCTIHCHSREYCSVLLLLSPIILLFRLYGDGGRGKTDFLIFGRDLNYVNEVKSKWSQKNLDRTVSPLSNGACLV